MGVAMAYPVSAMYNMYYDWNGKRFQEKVFSDLCYGVRTHYHAFNDRRWGKALEAPEAYELLNPVENTARLLNRFDPALPDIRLLVIFGQEAVQNWYPDESARGRYDVNDSLEILEKTEKLWDAGYLNALVSSDLVNNGSLTLDAQNRPVLNGHTFDAVVYLYPQYSKQPAMDFLERYAANGGKLLLEGDATHDFEGRDLSGWYARVRSAATVNGFNKNKIDFLGIQPNREEGTCHNEDGSVTYTDLRSLRSGEETQFELEVDGDTWSGTFIGLAAIEADGSIGLVRYAAAGGRELSRNGKRLFELEQATDLLIERNQDGLRVELLDPTGSNRVLVNRLGE